MAVNGHGGILSSSFPSSPFSTSPPRGRRSLRNRLRGELLRGSGYVYRPSSLPLFSFAFVPLLPLCPESSSFILSVGGRRVIEVVMAVLMIMLPNVSRTLFVPVKHVRGMGWWNSCYSVCHARLERAWIQAIVHASGDRGIPGVIIDHRG